MSRMWEVVANSTFGIQQPSVLLDKLRFSVYVSPVQAVLLAGDSCFIWEVPGCVCSTVTAPVCQPSHELQIPDSLVPNIKTCASSSFVC